MLRRLLLLLPILAGMVVTGASADGLSAPEGSVLLTVEGAIKVSNQDGVAAFDLVQLESVVPQGVIEEANPWEDGTPRFTGPVLSELLHLIGAEGSVLEMVALNDYRVEVPLSDAASAPIILATRRNGEAMSVRDRGPIWLIYPAETANTLGQDVMESRMIWQLERIIVR